MVDLLSRSVEATGRHAAPIPVSETEFAPVMVVIGAAVVVCVDALACTPRRAPLAGLPLLAVFTAPVTILGGVSWVIFGLAAGCFLLTLVAERAEALRDWAHSRAGETEATFVDSRPQPPRLGSQLTRASRIGVLGIGVAVVAPVLLPAGDGLLSGRDWPGGTGGGDDGVRLENPFVDMRRDLTRGDDIPLVEVRTNDPDPSYLRLTVLDEFDGITWRPAGRDLPPENQAAGEVPPVDGLAASTPRREYDWSVRVLETFDTDWLPAPYPYSAVDVNGDWRYDTDTMDLASLGAELDGAGVEYQLTVLELSPEQQALVTAPPAPSGVQSVNTDLPESLPREFWELADEVTAGAGSSFERAVMLQDWFREDGGFTYSLERAEGNDIEQLELFLGTGPGSRVGYCEQFASAMAMMARSLDIPARVAVGFLKPEKVGDTYLYSSHDLHAWPELYFEGVGWLRFEPTPPRRAEQVPEYTTGAVPAPQLGPTASDGPSAAVPSRPQAPDEAPTLEPETVTTDGTIPAWAGWLGGVAGAAVVTALACAPRLMRSSLRRQRLKADGRDSGAEDAWSEVRATAMDLRYGWDDGATLRRRAHHLVPLIGVAGDKDAVRALETLVLVLERARYSRQGVDPERSAEARRLARKVIEAMTATAGPRRRRRAAWLPSSLWRGRRPLHSPAMSQSITPDGGGAVPIEEREGVSI